MSRSEGSEQERCPSCGSDDPAVPWFVTARQLEAFGIQPKPGGKNRRCPDPWHSSAPFHQPVSQPPEGEGRWSVCLLPDGRITTSCYTVGEHGHRRIEVVPASLLASERAGADELREYAELHINAHREAVDRLGGAEKARNEAEAESARLRERVEELEEALRAYFAGPCNATADHLNRLLVSAEDDAPREPGFLEHGAEGLDMDPQVAAEEAERDA